MKTHRFSPLAGGLLLTVICHCPAHGQFNTLELWGNAVGTTPEASYTIQAGTISITAGGQDYWSASDQGAFLWNDTGTHTTTGDFTASVRHVSTTTPAPEWGRSGIMARATQSEGLLSANDAYWMPHRKSNGQFVINRRPSAGSATYRATDAGIDPNANDFTYNSDTNDRPLATGDITIVPWFLSIGREGDFWYGGYAMDLGGGVPGRWINHWSTDVAEAVEALQGEAEVIVGLAHQSHPQTISPDENDINTATFDNWAYQGNSTSANSARRPGPRRGRWRARWKGRRPQAMCSAPPMSVKGRRPRVRQSDGPSRFIRSRHSRRVTAWPAPAEIRRP